VAVQIREAVAAAERTKDSDYAGVVAAVEREAKAQVEKAQAERLEFQTLFVKVSVYRMMWSMGSCRPLSGRI